MAVSSAAAGTDRRRRRLAAIDVVRGFAIAAMIVYHFSWDLSAYGIVAVDVVNDPGWKAFARLIAGTFLALVGFNLVLATQGGFRRTAYLRRLAIVAAAAALVSVGTYLFVPDTVVLFGILHQIAVASVLALPFLNARLWIVGIASVACIVAPALLTADFFDSPVFLWLGLAAHPIPAVDYVPIFPWFGVVLAGVIGGRLYADAGDGAPLADWRPAGPFWRTVMFAGRWSLAIYLIHQPILIGAIYLTTAFVGVSEATLAERFVNQCSVNCRSAGQPAESCTPTCICLLGEMQKANIVTQVMSGRLNEADAATRQSILDRCAFPPPASP